MKESGIGSNPAAATWFLSLFARLMNPPKKLLNF